LGFIKETISYDRLKRLKGKPMMDEREFELINILGGDEASNQRDLAQHMNVSLGMVNMLIRRLIAKGYIRIEQLDKRKVQYILTPQGFAEKMQKSVKYAVKTLHSISLVRESLKNIVQRLDQQSLNSFTILGASDLAALVEIAFKEHFSRPYTIKKVKSLEGEFVEGILLICKEGYENGICPISGALNIIEEIAKKQVF
jgi:DNA-binding MarR family transcriptional regulator